MSMVALLSNYSLGVKGQKKDQIFNFVCFQQLRCQIVRPEPAIKSLNGDPVVLPFLSPISKF